jgi:hypothetical protein
MLSNGGSLGTLLLPSGYLSLGVRVLQGIPDVPSFSPSK